MRLLRGGGCRLISFGTVAFLFVVLTCNSALAYSVLTHEEIVDLVWTSELRPLLVQRFPGLSEDDLTEAHAYAYGGAVIQDLGYYPFGSNEFSDLTHYVRSGDFVVAMIDESRDMNELAFALGALSHYASDIAGHPAVNMAVPIEFPQLRAKYGPVVTYEQNKSAHLKTEFGFDVAQVAKGHYTAKQYHDYIGFAVSKPLLERVFPRVYGLELKEVLKHEDLAVGTYRRSVSSVIPKMTEIALLTRRKEIASDSRDFNEKEFLYRLSRADYEKEWGRDYERPGIGTRILAAILRIVPKIGPFKGLDFKGPTSYTDDLYLKSMNETVDLYRKLLRDVASGSLRLDDRDF